MIYIYFLLSILTAAGTCFARSRRAVHTAGGIFYFIQSVLLVHLFFNEGYGSTSGGFFAFDAAGTLFFVLMCVVSAFVFTHSEAYLRDNSLPEYRLYFALLMLLTTALTGVYFADNIAVTWIFLEGTTLCAAGLIYHRRTAQTLEAAWKYLFVCSTGIAMAYLGILLLSTAATGGDMSYKALATAVAAGNPL